MIMIEAPKATSMVPGHAVEVTHSCCAATVNVLVRMMKLATKKGAHASVTEPRSIRTTTR